MLTRSFVKYKFEKKFENNKVFQRDWVNMKKTMLSKVAFFGLALASAASAAVTVNTAEGWLESAFIEWAPVSGAKSYTVYADGKAIDKQLIRSYGSYMRADVVGLKAGSHTLKVESDNGQASDAKTVTVKAHDRAGFAFVDTKNHVPGAYNMDGTLKNGAVVLYISENTKNTVTMDVVTSSKGTTTTCKSFQGILNCMKKGYETRPVDFRFIGNVTDSDSLVQGDMLIDLGSSEKSFVTVEGIGTDAVANGWGIRIKNAQNIEVRNMGIMNVNSGEGDNIGLQQNDQYVWVHNNDFFYGDAGSDKDQVKGDGALDCKLSTYITFSYNHFWDNGKSNLLGLKGESTDGYFITYHHNWYDHSDSRHPRIRFYSAHVYNNYYDGNAKYGIGSTLGSSVFAEANYFRNCKYPMLTSMQGSDVYAGTTKRDPANYGTFSKEAGGSIKAFNNYIEGGTFIPYGASKYILKGVETAIGAIDSKKDFDAYVVTSRDQKMPAEVTSYDGANVHNNFDLNLPYSYNVDEPAAAKTNVMTYAGRVKGGDFKWTFNNAVDDEKYAVDEKLKASLVAYTGSLKSIQGDGDIKPVIPSSSSVASSSSVSSSSSKPVSSSSVSSSSSKPVSSSSVSSSSSKPASSSSVASSSSRGENEDVVDEGETTIAISESIVHNFTEDAASSDYFEFVGSLSDSKGSVTYKNEELTRCLKMESATQISFTLAKSAKVTLVFNSDFVKGVKIDGAKVTAASGIVEVDLAAGAHTITKGDVANLYLIAVEISSTTPESSSSVKDPESSSSSETSASSSSEKNPESSSSKDDENAIIAKDFAPNALHFEAGRLTVNVDGLQRVVIMGMTGKVVYAGSANVVNMNAFPKGMYIVQVKASAGMFQKRILNK